MSSTRDEGNERPALRDAIHAEWTKLRTAAGAVWMFVAAIVLTIGLGAATDASVSCSGPGCGVDVARTSFTGLLLGQALVAVAAVSTIGAEYASGMIRVSIAATPQRLVGFVAKVAVVGAAAVGTAVVSVAGSLAAGWIILPGKGLTAANRNALPGLTDAAMLRATLCAILYLSLIAMLSLGIAYVVRDSVAAVGIVLGLLYLFPIVAQVISDQTWHRRLERLGPMTAGLASQTTQNIATQPITPWHGIGVVALWAAGALVAGGAVLRRRDA